MLADQAVRAPPNLQLLVNNSGVRDEWSGLEEVTAADMLHCFQTNAIGPLLVTQQLHKQRLLGSGSGGGSLVANMSSKASWACCWVAAGLLVC